MISIRCWICDSSEATLIRKGIDPANLKPDNFSITDSNYGLTLDLYKCRSCGFEFCPTAGNVVNFYQELVDEDYERTRTARSLQAKKLLQSIESFSSVSNPGKLRLLDIGAGTGILVEQAINLGYEALGIEPGNWLAAKAKERQLPVICGSFPCAELAGKFDVITLVDVLEHVTNPVELLSDIAKHLKPGGIGIVVTPDIDSIIARIMGKRWWHFRIAHVGYFSRRTLIKAFNKAGLEPASWIRPAWYFPIDYILLRLDRYVPFIGLRHLARFASRYSNEFSLPLNLRDSWMAVVRTKK